MLWHGRAVSANSDRHGRMLAERPNTAPARDLWKKRNRGRTALARPNRAPAATSRSAHGADTPTGRRPRDPPRTEARRASPVSPFHRAAPAATARLPQPKSPAARQPPSWLAELLPSAVPPARAAPVPARCVPAPEASRRCPWGRGARWLVLEAHGAGGHNVRRPPPAWAFRPGATLQPRPWLPPLAAGCSRQGPASSVPMRACRAWARGVARLPGRLPPPRRWALASRLRRSRLPPKATVALPSSKEAWAASPQPEAAGGRAGRAVAGSDEGSGSGACSAPDG